MSDRRITKGLLIISAGIVLYFLISMLIDGMFIWGHGPLEYEKTGQVGDFIGGVIGTIINGAAFYFLYLTLQEQRNVSTAQQNANLAQAVAFEKERLETNFFELLKLHRENVVEMSKETHENGITTTHEGRKVIHLIVSDVFTCREEIKPFYRRKTESDIYTPEYAAQLKKAFKYSNPAVNLVKLAKMNIPYCIVFYGVDAEGMRILEGLFEGKYNPKFYKPLLDYISLKPVKNHPYFDKWDQIRHISDAKTRITIALGTRIRRGTSYDRSTYSGHAASLIEDLWYKNDFTKYYGGNQFRLGHYFRHFYQTVDYIDKQVNLDWKAKYFYIKTLRGQLSTHEQVLFFANSLSFMGMIWELTPKFEVVLDEEINRQRAKEKMLVTKYQLIKNIPRKDIFGFKIPDFYPNVKLERDDFSFLESN